MKEKYMQLALEMAKKAFNNNEVPVGAVLVYNDKYIIKASNKREKRNNILGHAEVIAINKMCRKLKSWKLNGCDLYVTLKPCSMCLEIIKQARIDNVYYLLEKPLSKKEYDKTKLIKVDIRNNYEDLLRKFFQNKRS